MSKGDLLRRETSHRMMKLRVEREGMSVVVYVCMYVGICVHFNRDKMYIANSTLSNIYLIIRYLHSNSSFSSAKYFPRLVMGHSCDFSSRKNQWFNRLFIS